MRVSASICLSTVLALLVPARALAQTTVTGGVEVGARVGLTMPADSELAKFLQFRDMPFLQYRNRPSGLDWQSGYLRVARDSFQTLQLFGHNLGLQDQNLGLRANHPGLADVQLRWDKIPHVFSTNARFLGTDTAAGIYVLPTPRNDTVTLNHSAIVAPVQTRWDPVKAAFLLTPNTHWDFKAEYQHTDKNGSRPMGMAFGGSNNNAREINEPINQTMNDVRLSQAYTQPHFQMMLSYAYSQFDNALQSVTSDNPLSTVDSFKLGSARGRTALAPNNTAHTVTTTAAVSLPRYTRVTGTLSYGWRNQNQDFIAPTINSKNLDSLSRAHDVFPVSLNGNIHTSLANVTLTSRPVRPVTITARYRFYDFKDETADISVPVLVISDRTFAAGAEREAFPYTRYNADIGVGVHPLTDFTLSTGYAWERMERDSAVRNVSTVTEDTHRFSLDYMGIAWASLRLSYNHGVRRGSVYHQVTTSENPDSRRLDESDRNRNSWNFMASVTPIDQVTVTGSWQMGRDTFPNTSYGVQRDNSNTYGFEVEWAPIPRFAIGGGYEREWYNNQFSARYRTGSVDSLLNNPTWNWVATNIDTSSTTFATLNATLVPNRLELGVMWQSAKSTFQMQAFNPVTPARGTATQIAAATAMSFPAATQTLEPVTLNLRYRMSADWFITARYHSEYFTNYDFRTTGLKPANGNYIFEGNNLLPYDLDYFTIMVSFRPGLLRLPRSAM